MKFCVGSNDLEFSFRFRAPELKETAQKRERAFWSLPVVSTIPSRMTTISNCSFIRERLERSKKGLLGLISWQMVRGDTRKS